MSNILRKRFEVTNIAMPAIIQDAQLRGRVAELFAIARGRDAERRDTARAKMMCSTGLSMPCARVLSSALLCNVLLPGLNLAFAMPSPFCSVIAHGILFHNKSL